MSFRKSGRHGLIESLWTTAVEKIRHRSRANRAMDAPSAANRAMQAEAAGLPRRRVC
jgi:hypothetical protein